MSYQTGAVYGPSLIASFASLSKRYDIALIIDETYRDFITNDVPHYLFVPGHLQKTESKITFLPEDWTWRSTFIHLFSFSKSYCVPGHRLGAIVAPSAVLDQVRTVLDCLQICAPRSIQLALQSLLPDLRPFIREKRTGACPPARGIRLIAAIIMENRLPRRILRICPTPLQERVGH